ncbi:MAG TPA: 2-dehydropantoate 2-reductase [Deltaproteobacteria bacterium]|nr:2-dehydropantoate 2-reductase [Deltaproteobacteria bacterium]
MQIGVLGAGAVGCTLGGRLAHGGSEVVLVGRPSMAARLTAGLTLSRWGEPAIEVPRTALRFETEAGALSGCDIVLVCVKSRDTLEAGRQLEGVVRPGTVVASLQNGTDNAPILARALPGCRIWPGMVSFNIVCDDEGRFHQGTSGPVVLPADASALVEALRAGGCEARTHRDVPGVLWGKLLLNLNNAVNALSGLPLREQLSERRYRHQLAKVIEEGRRVLRAAHVRARGVGRLRPGLAPWVLRLPDLLFFRVAAAMIAIDPRARSSMADDLDRGRPTEVDSLNGTIVHLAQRAGVPAPLNATLVRLIHQAEEDQGSPRLSAEELERALEA